MKIVKNTKVFTNSWKPEEVIIFQGKELEKIKSMFSQKNGESCLVICGRSGTGKTTIIKHFMKQNIMKKIVYIQFPENATEMFALTSIASELRIFVKSRSSAEWKRKIGEYLKEYNTGIMFILDEVDKLVKKAGDDILYHIGEWGVPCILISNDDSVFDRATERTKSRLGGMPGITFRPYNAKEIMAILKQRAEEGLESGSYDDKFLLMLSAYCAQNHGDARKSIDHLRACAILAEKEGTKITEKLIKEAESLADIEEAIERVGMLPPVSKLALRAMVNILRERKWTYCRTNEITEEYEKLATERGFNMVGERRIVDFVWNWTNFGITESKLLSSHTGIGRVLSFRLPIEKVDIALNKDGY